MQRGIFFQARLPGVTAQIPIKDQATREVIKEEARSFLLKLTGPNNLVVNHVAQFKFDLAA